MPMEDGLVTGNNKEQNALNSTMDISVQNSVHCLAFNLQQSMCAL